MFHSKKYQVQSGDTLTGITKRFGLPSWKNIYNSPENAQWKAMCGTPDNLQIGDVISIPPNPILVLDRQLQGLNKLRNETETMFDQLLYQAKQDYNKINGYGAKIDLAAGLLQLGVGYGKIVKGGMDTMKMSGVELAKANRDLAKASISIGPQYVAEQVISQSSFLKVTGEEGLATALGKIVVNSWFDMTSPSYWAKRITGVNPEQIYQQATQNILQNKAAAMNRLDGRIQEIRSEMLKQRLGATF